MGRGSNPHRYEHTHASFVVTMNNCVVCINMQKAEMLTHYPKKIGAGNVCRWFDSTTKWL
jgi:hypothetical protein